ncbi:2',3'-cyclic-nucleotide 3'-phosphodiesterase [Chytridium lagenaria]|nr:2',3'-cyclic-nucleotide 3'-phosphodiesterase [Chytridium lagenaria]
MSSPPGFSFWIGPPAGSKLDQNLVDIVNVYSNRLGTPKWQPHITLLGQITESYNEVEAKLTKLCKTVKPFKVHLTDIVIKDQFFQCIMAKVEETNEIMELNARVADVFPRPQAVYWPHLSLVYGDLTNETKASVQAEIRESETCHIIGAEVEICTIEVWCTEGPVKSWYKMGEIRLEG